MSDDEGLESWILDERSQGRFVLKQFASYFLIFCSSWLLFFPEMDNENLLPFKNKPTNSKVIPNKEMRWGSDRKYVI